MTTRNDATRNATVYAEHTGIYSAALQAAVSAGYDNTRVHPFTRRTRAAGVATRVRDSICNVNAPLNLSPEQISAAIADGIARELAGDAEMAAERAEER